MDKGDIVGAIFLDLKKAFDTVNHQVLIHKMSYFNFSPCAIDWMSSYLSDRVQCVRVSGETSPPLRNELGVPQGSILGPVLFSLYINDLPSVCTGCEVQMYADDTVIYVHAKTKAQAAAQLSCAMVHVHQWLADSQPNVKKTACMLFGKSNTVSHCEPKVYVSGEVIQTVTHFKYLLYPLKNK